MTKPNQPNASSEPARLTEIKKLLPECFLNELKQLQEEIANLIPVAEQQAIRDALRAHPITREL